MVDRQEVINAFAKTHRPADHSLCACDCAECQWDISKFKGKTWSRLQMSDFGADDGDANIALLTPEAFHYFLPGFLLLVLDNQDARWLLDRIVDRLTISDREADDRRARLHQDIKYLSPRQKQSLVDVFGHLEPSVPHASVIWQSLISSLKAGDAIPYRFEDLEASNLTMLKQLRENQSHG
jgi:hypothetical protein